MRRSTFVLDPTVQDNVAAHFNADGERTPHLHFAVKAATSLHTAAADLQLFLAAHADGPGGSPAGGGVIDPASVAAMLQPNATLFGIDIWGLGAMLYAPVIGEPRFIGHDGHNAPGIGATARVDMASGDGIIVLTSGYHALAPELGSAWIYWKTGTVDIVQLARSARQTAVRLAAGGIVIWTTAALLWWHSAHRRAASSRPG